jgi:WD40 repeat protein/Zn-dependent protease with chaperone function
MSWSAPIDTVSSYFIESLWRACGQGSLAIGVAWAICLLWPRLSPSLRCWLWRLAYLKLIVSLITPFAIVLPLLPGVPPPSAMLHTAAVPQPMPTAGPANAVASQSHTNLVTPPVNSTIAPRPQHQHAYNTGQQPTAVMSEPIDLAQTHPPPKPPDERRARQTSGNAAQRRTMALPTIASVLLLLWLSGVLWCSTRLWRQWRQTQRLRQSCAPVHDATLLTCCEVLRQRLGIAGVMQLMVTRDAIGPLLIGAARPIIVLPSALLNACTAAELELLLAHELAHVKRRDLVWNWLPGLARVLFFFHPLVWLAQHEWRLAQEMACDRLALTATGAAPAVYGEILLKVATQFRATLQPRCGAVAVVESHGTLRRRLLQLRQPLHLSRRQWALAAGCVILLGILGILPWRLVRPVAGAAPGKQENPAHAMSIPTKSGERPQLVLQFGHNKPLTAVAFSPDGRMLATGDEDGTLKLWQTATGMLLSSWHGHAGIVLDMVFSPDGRTLVSSGGGDSVRCWDVRMSWLRPTLYFRASGNSWIDTVCFSPNGRTLAGNGHNGSVTLWDATNGRVKRVIRVHTEIPSVAAAFSPDGRMLAVLKQDAVLLYDGSSGFPLRALPLTSAGKVAETLALAFSRDGAILRVAHSDRITFWNLHTNKLIKTVLTPSIRVYEPPHEEESDVFSGGGSYDYPTITEEFSDDGHTAVGLSLAKFVIWKRPYAYGYPVYHVQVWNTDTGKVLRTFPGEYRWSPRPFFAPNAMQRHTARLAVSRDGMHIALGSGNEAENEVLQESGEVRLWNLTNSTPKWTHACYEDRSGPVFYTQDGKSILSVGTDYALRLWDAKTGSLKRILPPPGNKVVGRLWAVALSPDGTTLAAGEHVDDAIARIWIWNANTGKLLHVFAAHREDVGGVAFSPDGKTLVSGGGTLYKGDLCFWDVASGRLLHRTSGHEGGVQAVAFSPDGATVASGSFDNTVKLWNVRTGALMRTLPQYGGWVSAVAFSADGRWVAAGNEGEGTAEVTIWNVHTGKVRHTWETHDSAVSSLAFSQDGATLVVGYRSGPNNSRIVRFFDTVSGRITASIRGQGSRVSLAPDGKAPLIADKDKAFGLWDMQHRRLLATVTTTPPSTPGAIAPDWVTYTPDGYYDCSPGAERYIAWRVGDKMEPAAAYATRFHRPDLVEAQISGQ